MGTHEKLFCGQKIFWFMKEQWEFQM